MQQWVHRGMVEWFEAQPQQRSAVRAMIERERFAGRNCNGAFLGIKKDLHGAASSVMPVWVECALNRSCIAPEGSSRRNHRQDQAALTMLTKLRLPPSSGCQPLRSDGSMRFWRDQCYDVNSPVHFAELKRTDRLHGRPPTKEGLRGGQGQRYTQLLAQRRCGGGGA